MDDGRCRNVRAAQEKKRACMTWTVSNKVLA